MKNILLCLAAMIVFSSCSTTSSTVPAETDSVRYDNRANTLTAVMTPAGSAKIRFTVYNRTDSAQSFLKWHTPFEPLISKYLDIHDSSGREVNYAGAMARRKMPPPQSDYIQVAPGDSLSVLVNLLEGYAITEPGTYSVVYNGSGMSKLFVRDSVMVIYER